MPAPITSIMMLIGRSAAARNIRFRSSGERGTVARPSGGPDLGLRRSDTVDRRGDQTHLSSDLERERVGGATFVYGQAKAPVGVWDEHQLARLGRPERLDVSDGHPAVTGVDSQVFTVLEPRLLLHDGEPCVAIAVDGDDVGNETLSFVYQRALRAESHQRSRVHRLPELRKADPGRKMGGRGGEDIAAVKGVGDGMQVEALLG